MSTRRTKRQSHPPPPPAAAAPPPPNPHPLPPPVQLSPTDQFLGNLRREGPVHGPPLPPRVEQGGGGEQGGAGEGRGGVAGQGQGQGGEGGAQGEGTVSMEKYKKLKKRYFDVVQQRDETASQLESVIAQNVRLRNERDALADQVLHFQSTATTNNNNGHVPPAYPPPHSHAPPYPGPQYHPQHPQQPQHYPDRAQDHGVKGRAERLYEYQTLRQGQGQGEGGGRVHAHVSEEEEEREREREKEKEWKRRKEEMDVDVGQRVLVGGRVSVKRENDDVQEEKGRKRPRVEPPPMRWQSSGEVWSGELRGHGQPIPYPPHTVPAHPPPPPEHPYTHSPAYYVPPTPTPNANQQNQDLRARPRSHTETSHTSQHSTPPEARYHPQPEGAYRGLVLPAHRSPPNHASPPSHRPTPAYADRPQPQELLSPPVRARDPYLSPVGPAVGEQAPGGSSKGLVEKAYDAYPGGPAELKYLPPPKPNAGDGSREPRKGRPPSKRFPSPPPPAAPPPPPPAPEQPTRPPSTQQPSFSTTLPLTLPYSAASDPAPRPIGPSPMHASPHPGQPSVPTRPPSAGTLARASRPVGPAPPRTLHRPPPNPHPHPHPLPLPPPIRIPSAGPSRTPSPAPRPRLPATYVIPPVPREGGGGGGGVRLPVQVGVVMVVQLGRVRGEEGWANGRHVWCEGFESTRTYLSMFDPRRETTYRSLILASPARPGPVFRVVPEDQPEQYVERASPTAAWAEVMTRALAIRERPPNPHVSGTEQYGLASAIVKHLIQSLPGVRELPDYHWENFVEDTTSSFGHEADHLPDVPHPPSIEEGVMLYRDPEPPAPPHIQTPVATAAAGEPNGHAYGEREEEDVRMSDPPPRVARSQSYHREGEDVHMSDPPPPPHHHHSHSHSHSPTVARETPMQDLRRSPVQVRMDDQGRNRSASTGGSGGGGGSRPGSGGATRSPVVVRDVWGVEGR